ncbi:hypothetical protein ETI06_02175 [Macrococcoides goetzii]|nr:SGNH hydrolase domain-containing protein [Macrococcus goetzii]TDM50805.1 hypothetical protein ETI06_02175 [Macrococcus goetzii]
MKKFAILFWSFLVVISIFTSQVDANELSISQYPGVLENKKTSYPLRTLRPSTSNAFADHNQGFLDGCHAGKYGSYPKKVCQYGRKTGFNYTVAIIGDSHSSHWLAAVEKFAYDYKIRVLLATKSGCTLTSTQKSDYASCNKWNKTIIPAIAKYNPDVVLTKANNTQTGYRHDAGIINKFRELNNHNIKVFAIRDTPYFKSQVPDCVRLYGRNSVKCKVAKSHIPPSPAWVKAVQAEPNVKYVDYTNLICNKGTYCNPTQGNIIIMRDKHHMTNTYSRTFYHYIFKDLYPYLKEVRAGKIAQT